MGKRERNKLNNYNAILEAGRASFIEHGYEFSTVRDIITRTPLGSGTYYNYFPDKESLLRELVNVRMQALAEQLAQTRRRAKSLHGFVHNTYLAAFEAVAEDALFHSVLSGHNARARSMCEDTIADLTMDALEADVRDAMTRGLMPLLDVEYVTAAFFGIGFEIGRALARRRRRDPKAAADMATQLLLHGIGAR